MTEWIRETIIDHLHGKHLHVDPLIAVEGLSENEAMKKVSLNGFSIFELLFHIVFWLDYSLNLINGEINDFEKGIDWDIRGSSWDRLLEKYAKSLFQLESITKVFDLNSTLRINENLETSVGAEVLGTIQHMSYHLGQIVYVRRVLDLWPQRP
jgi:hypothetical protein